MQGTQQIQVTPKRKSSASGKESATATVHRPQRLSYHRLPQPVTEKVEELKEECESIDSETDALRDQAEQEREEVKNRTFAERQRSTEAAS